MSDARARIGREGEAAAARHLEAAGYTLLARNWACPPVGELDLVARRGELLVFVEVRTVSTRFLASPTLTVQPAKQLKVARTAERYLSAHPVRWASIRFDIIGVFNGGRGWQVEHLENAFVPPWAF